MCPSAVRREIRYICFLLLWIMLFPPFQSWADGDCSNIADSVSHGGIVWTENAVVVQGTASPGVSRNKNRPVSAIKQMAKRAATLDAYRKAAAVLAGVRVTSNSVAVDNVSVVSEIQTYVRQAKICKEKFYADGGVDVVVMVPLSGAFAMAQLQGAGTKIADTPSKYTGLIVDATDIPFAPALAPRLLSPQGDVLFSKEQVDRKLFESRGAVNYIMGPGSADSGITGEHPLRVRAIGAGAISPSDLIVDEQAALILAAAPYFLGKGRVAVIISPPRKVACKEAARKVENHRVDWEEKIVFARGRGKVDFDRTLDAATRIRMLERAAEVDAQRILLKTLSEIRIDGNRRLKDHPEASIYTTGIVLNAVRCDAKYFKDGTAEVVLSVPLDGLVVKGAGLGGREQRTLAAPESAVTGVIVDASGLAFKPVLAPALLSPGGIRVFAHEMVSRAWIELYGVVEYRSTLNGAKSALRAGDTPLVVKAVKAGDDTGQLILTAEDANALKRLGGQTGLLDQGRVVIVTGNTIGD